MNVTNHAGLPDARRIVALATATALPPEKGAKTFHLSGIGFFAAEQTDVGWRFDLQIGVATPDLGIAPLLRWAERQLPGASHVVGWQMLETSVPAMLSAADDGPADIATGFLKRLADLIGGGTTDLAVDHGGAGAMSFADHALALGLPVSPLTPGQLLEAWRGGSSAPVRVMLEQELLALLHLALLISGEVHARARVAFGRWLADRHAGEAAC